jgi:hypothetical protein
MLPGEDIEQFSLLDDSTEPFLERSLMTRRSLPA